MNRVRSMALAVAAASVTGVVASAEQPDPFAPLLRETRPLDTRLETDYTGNLQLGLGYTSSDSAMFGQYNGLSEQGANLIGKLNWNQFANRDSYWRMSGSDLGLDTREGAITWGRVDQFKLSMEFDSQLQAGNISSATPFRGSNNLRLPENWVSGVNTSDFAALNDSLHDFEREIERNRYALGVEARLNDQWQLRSNLRYEDKQGTSDVGAAIFTDASAGDAALLPLPIDYHTTEFDLGLAYLGTRLSLDGQLFYSEFDNSEALLSWQNPYSNFGPSVRYPEGIGGLGLAPDNELSSGRLTGQYRFSNTARLQFDSSYALTRQDQDFVDYTINPLLTVTEPLPQDSLDGEIATATTRVKLLLRPLPKLGLEISYRNLDKDYDAPRDGYQYVPGDGGSQSRPALTVYNTRQDYWSQTFGAEATYRLPMQSKARLQYDFETIERENAAVDKTEESRLIAGYRIQPWQSFTSNIELHFGDRAADTYDWSQSYYAMLDTELINATPDEQRYQNHPAMSQFYLSNREYVEARLDFNYLPNTQWSFNLNLVQRDEDFDKTQLGLTDTRWQRAHLSASYFPATDLTLSFYGGFDNYQSSQSSRAFRGGQEKNAFAVSSPLPQASDPERNWDIDGEDASVTLGANLEWQLRHDFALLLDYSFVDTDSRQDFNTYGASDLSARDLPAVDTHLHHIKASGTWQLREALSLRLDYQYYRYSTDDWAYDGLRVDTLNKVLSFGQRNPNEQIHYVGTSVIYHWQ